MRSSVPNQSKSILSAVENGPVRPKLPAEGPKTWSFTDVTTGEKRTITCMIGCEMDHSHQADAVTAADDIECRADSLDVTLPVNVSGEPEEFRVLSTIMSVMPFDTTLAYRLPHVSMELITDHWIEGMGPDELATVIETLAGRLDALRMAHAQLVAVRNEYKNRAR
ncbi:hypothetical protein HY68_12790 [Streptomyces sp. AcH 505]|uniref:DUF6907 domain-containing protein n=1 Tax=Streptomyces sp. AcH 505 TaxID=352211 RepID=UPI00059231A8|nr:hypothetical protein HY68_12790 [Streptomyces sp. AcH 505]